MNIRTSIFQNILYLVNSTRSYCRSHEGIKYIGFTYYPRSKDFKDSPYEPSKLFLIRRVKPMHGRSPVEKQCLALLNIDGDTKSKAHISVVKNIPSTNALLWKIKHLIEIKPITWKGELPKDFSGTYLRDTGELVISPKLVITPEQVEATEKLLKYDKKPDRSYLKEYLKRKWWDGFTGTA